jgi:hypothetical protein
MENDDLRQAMENKEILMWRRRYLKEHSNVEKDSLIWHTFTFLTSDTLMRETPEGYLKKLQGMNETQPA